MASAFAETSCLEGRVESGGGGPGGLPAPENSRRSGPVPHWFHRCLREPFAPTWREPARQRRPLSCLGGRRASLLCHSSRRCLQHDLPPIHRPALPRLRGADSLLLMLSLRSVGLAVSAGWLALNLCLFAGHRKEANNLPSRLVLRRLDRDGDEDLGLGRQAGQSGLDLVGRGLDVDELRCPPRPVRRTTPAADGCCHSVARRRPRHCRHNSCVFVPSPVLILQLDASARDDAVFGKHLVERLLLRRLGTDVAEDDEHVGTDRGGAVPSYQLAELPRPPLPPYASALLDAAAALAMGCWSGGREADDGGAPWPA